MEKDRARRYASAAELAADLQRYLDDEPAVAGPPSATYRALKFVRRNRVLVGTGLLVLLALVVGLIGTYWGWQRARAQTEIALRAQTVAEEAQREAAEAARMAEVEQRRLAVEAMEEAALARAATGFLVELLDLANPAVALDPETGLRTLLVRASEEAGEALVGQPEAEAAVRSLCQGAFDEDPLSALLLGRQWSVWAETLGNRGQAADDVRPIFEAAIERLASHAERADPVSLLRCDWWLATFALQAGDAELAEHHARRCLELAREHAPDHWMVANGRFVLGATLSFQGRLADAEIELVEAAKSLIRTRGWPTTTPGTRCARCASTTRPTAGSSARRTCGSSCSNGRFGWASAGAASTSSSTSSCSSRSNRRLKPTCSRPGGLVRIGAWESTTMRRRCERRSRGRIGLA